MSRGGSVDGASASTSIRQSITSSPRVDGQRQGPISFAEQAQLETFQPTWEQGLTATLESDPWILSVPDIWGTMAREMEQCGKRCQTSFNETSWLILVQR